MALAVGPRAPRLAHRVLGDGRGAARRRVRHPRRRLDLVFPHHENEAAQTLAARGRPLARMWMHNGMVQLGRREKMAKSESGNIRGLREVLDEVGRDALILYFCGRPLPPAARLLARAPQEAARARRAHPRGGPAARARRLARRTWRRCATRSSTRWPTTSTRARALASAVRLDPRGQPARAAGRRRAPARDARRARRSRTCSTAAAGAPAGAARAGRAARRGPRAARLRRGRPAARRAARTRLGGARRARRARARARRG